MGRIIDRFDEYMSFRHLNDNRVTAQLGLTNGVIGKSRGKGRDLSKRVIEKIEKFYTDLNIEWLITGEGEMLIPATPVHADHTFPLRTDRALTVQDIPLYDFDAAAGLVAIFSEMHVDPVDYLRIPNLPAVDGAIFVRGDSMSPLLKSGDIVMYKKKELSIDSIIWGEIYLLSFQTDGDSYTAVKYIRKSETPGMVCLASFNPSFAPKDIPMSAITALALVKASLTFHTME